jgi:hypothetical protein
MKRNTTIALFYTGVAVSRSPSSASRSFCARNSPTDMSTVINLEGTALHV